jgi:hypothetical protein
LKDGTFLVFSLGTIILILNSIEEQIILDFHWFMKDEEAIDWKEGFPQLPLDICLFFSNIVKITFNFET